MASGRSRTTIWIIALTAFVGLVLWLVFVSGGPGERLVVYCAHDSIHSEQIIREFERASGIPVEVKFDTEATKSLGLVELIVREAEQPRCDVFWNNEILGTLDLEQRDLFLPYRGPQWQRFPSAFKDVEGRWTGFGARLRVIIRNDRASENPPPAHPAGDRWAIAKPLYGTTLTHFTLIWSHLGPEKTQQWHRQLLSSGVRVLNGNAAVKDAVGAGVCDAGWTDTDDFFLAKDAGLPVSMEPVRLEDGKTICIPNTVAIIRGTKREALARQFVDFLLSEQTELTLANSKARQIPLGPVDESRLPDEVRQIRVWGLEGAPLRDLTKARAECLEWLKSEYTQ